MLEYGQRNKAAKKQKNSTEPTDHSDLPDKLVGNKAKIVKNIL